METGGSLTTRDGMADLRRHQEIEGSLTTRDGGGDHRRHDGRRLGVHGSKRWGGGQETCRD